MDNKQKILLVGPVYPYMGGISHYTGLLYRALHKKFDVSMISYSFQYPKLLYQKQQKDESDDSFKVEAAKYWIHTANPINWFRSARNMKKEKADMIIIQWWHPYFAPCYWVISQILKKEKLIFVCHNVFPHERFVLDRWLTKRVLRQGDAFIVHSASDGDDLKTVVKNPLFTQAVHPTYDIFKFDGISGEEARLRLQIAKDQKVLLFFGFVREYKGLKYLLQALPLIKNRMEDILLLIVGSFNNDKEEYLELIRTHGLEENIRIVDGYIPNHEVEPYFAASDLVVLPYVSATQSGIVQIAFGFEKPVVVTDVGGLPDVVTDGRNGYIVAAGDAEPLAEAVVRYFRLEKAKEFTDCIKAEAERFSWDRLSEAVETLWKRMV